MRRAAVLLALLALLPGVLPVAQALHAPSEPIAPPFPVFLANHCGVGDVQLGETAYVGLQCGYVQVVAATHLCDVYDWGLACQLAWEARAVATRWAGPGSLAGTLASSCSDAEARTWLPGGAVGTLDVVLTCTTPPFTVPRTGCNNQTATVRADFDGLLAAPDQALTYTSAVCDRRDPL